MTLRWRSVLSSGSITMGDTNENEFRSFNLTVPPSDSAAALLMFSGKNVDFERNFVTVNMPNAAALDDISHNAANDHDWFVSRILPTGGHWTGQTHRINPGILRAGANHFGVHARTSDGTAKASTAENADDFQIARVFVLYTQD